MIPGSRVLACAPSNSATDLLCEGVLQHWPKKEVLRLNAYTRPLTSDISEDVLVSRLPVYSCVNQCYKPVSTELHTVLIILYARQERV